MKKLNLLLIVCVFLGSQISAQEAATFSPEVKRVAVFKNGYAFTYREGETKIVNNTAYSTNLPIGVLGTVWGYAKSPDIKVKQLIATEIEKRGTERVIDTAELLLANEGARIRFKDSYNELHEGTYQILSENRGFEKTADGFNRSNLTIVLNTENGVMLFPAANLRQLEFLQMPGFQKPTISKVNRMMFQVEGAKTGQTTGLGIAALERGIRWIPAYRVQIKDDPVKEVKLELEAMLINELTDLTDTEVYFVVGVPYFLFQDTMSPLSINTAFAGVSRYFQSGSRGGAANAYSNAIMTQVASTADSAGSLQPDGLPTVDGEEQAGSFSAEQLYLYKADQINLKKDERASLRLFSLTVPASEIFEWTLNDSPDTERRYLEYARNSTSVPLMENLSSKMWYALRLKNQTGMPWTTAPVLTFRDWKPLGQDMLTFTPVKGENILRVTPATEVFGTHTLEEKARERTTLDYNGSRYNFDLVTVEGTIKIKNVKKETVEVAVTRNFVGETVSATDDGRMSKEGLNLQSVNPTSIIKWNVRVPPGEKEIKYTYKIYVRR